MTITANIIPDPFKYFFGRIQGPRRVLLPHARAAPGLAAAPQLLGPGLRTPGHINRTLIHHKVQYLNSHPNTGSVDQR